MHNRLGIPFGRARSLAVSFVVAAVAATTVAIAAAAPPANDDLDDAIPLTAGVEVDWVLTTEATAEVDEDPCVSGGVDSIWYSFTAPAAGEYAAYLADSTLDTSVAWHDDVDVQVSCQDDSSTSKDGVVMATFTEGQTRYVRVAGFQDVVLEGHGRVGVAAVETGLDDFADAGDLVIDEGTGRAALGIRWASATTETDEPADCGPLTLNHESTWVGFTPPETRSWRLGNHSEVSTDVAVYVGTDLASLSLVNCTANGNASLIAELDAGTRYWIRVGASEDEAGVVFARPAALRFEHEEIYATASGIDQVDLQHFESGLAAITVETPSDTYVFMEETGGVWSSETVPGTAGLNSSSWARVSLAELDTGEPAFVYHASAGGLRYAWRSSGGAWTDESIDADTSAGRGARLLIAPDGTPTVVYARTTDAHIMFATRGAGGWTTETVQPITFGSTAGDYFGMPAFAFDPTGEVAITYGTYTDGLYLVTHDGVSWSAEKIFSTAEDGPLRAIEMQWDSEGRMLAPFLSGRTSNLMVAIGDGETWTAEANTAQSGLADNDWECAQSGSTIDSADTLSVAWIDCNTSGTLAVTQRAADGTWTLGDAISSFVDPSSGDFEGHLETWSTDTVGAVMVDDRLHVMVTRAHDDSLWLFRDALQASAPTVGPMEGTFDLDLSGSSDTIGEIASYTWTDLPAGCAVSGSGTGQTMTCADYTTDTGFTGTAKLIVTDVDGNVDIVAVPIDLANFTCSDDATPFLDMPAQTWAADAIACIYELAVTTGTTGTTFDPAGFVTRKQMATFMGRLYEAVGQACVGGSTPFTDMPPEAWAIDGIECVYALGVTTGTSDTTFSPDDFVTRKQMAAFLARLYESLGGTCDAVATPFTDMPPETWAADAIACIYDLGVTTGATATTFEPDEPVTRMQMAAFIARLFEAL